MIAGVADRVGGWLRQGVRAVVAPTIFLGLVAYFLWNATQGDRGLQAYALRQEQLRGLQTELANVQSDQAAWEQRVGELRSQHLDPDMLDERARAMLSVADPNDIVMLYGSGKRLFAPP